MVCAPSLCQIGYGMRRLSGSFLAFMVRLYPLDAEEDDILMMEYVHTHNVRKYLFEWLVFAQYSSIFYFYEGGRHYDGREPASARGKPKTIVRLLPDLPTYSRRGSQYELDMNSPSWEVSGSLRCTRAVPD